jgi:hypothetical protein
MVGWGVVGRKVGCCEGVTVICSSPDDDMEGGIVGC